MDLALLNEPFEPLDIEWRVQSSGFTTKGQPWAMVLAYVTNRAIMDRLDEVCGKSNWRNEYDKAPDGGIMCGLSIKIDDEWVTKWDGAENTQVEAVKGGLSNAMKRAAVQWGIGRYLYNLETSFVQLKDSGEHRIKIEDKQTKKWSTYYGYWDRPKLPEWAQPKRSKQSSTTSTAKVRESEK